MIFLRNHDEFKTELMRRKSEFDQLRHRRTRLITQSVCAALCLCLVLSFLLPGTMVPATPTDPIIDNPTLSTSPSDSTGIRPDNTQTLNLLANFIPQNIQGKPLDEAFTAAQMDFALNLLRGSHSGDNTLVSPLSATLALSMTASGAGGNTLTQMEQVLCGGMDIKDWNQYLKYYVNQLPTSKDAKLSIANSIWYDSKAGLTVNPIFLQTVADHYNADIFSSPFGPKTLLDINDWISDNTDGLINNALDKLDGIMYLINALVFDGKWAQGYNDYDVRTQDFHAANGEIQASDMMFSTESWYLESENARGFMKDYAGGNYRFVAILPDEDLSLNAYLESLTPEDLTSLLDGAKHRDVRAGLPQFEYEFDISLNDVLMDLGITDAFDPGCANLTPMATCNDGSLYVSRVIHKTFITVDAKGTKAAASTIVEMEPTSMPMPAKASVILDRPFLYMIVDTQTNLPIFMGTVTNLG